MTFDELNVLTRRKLMLRLKDISETELRALWCALDADDSNQILQDEALSFLKLAPMRTRDSLADTNVRGGGVEARKKAKEAKKAAEEAKIAAYNSVNIDAVCRTKEMRRELEEDGVPPLDEFDLLDLSELFNERLEEAREKSGTASRSFHDQKGKTGKSAWINLFKEIDTDGRRSHTHKCALHRHMHASWPHTLTASCGSWQVAASSLSTNGGLSCARSWASSRARCMRAHSKDCGARLMQVRPAKRVDRESHCVSPRLDCLGITVAHLAYRRPPPILVPLVWHCARLLPSSLFSWARCADDSDQIQIQEIGHFLRGDVSGFLQAQESARRGQTESVWKQKPLADLEEVPNPWRW